MSNKTRRTAVEVLIEKLSNYDKEILFLFRQEIEQVKEIEKEQIKEAYFIGGYQMKNNKYIGMHEYYNETYGGNK
jgi:hypothetical protein